MIFYENVEEFVFDSGLKGRLYQRYMVGERKDCAQIADALHSCMFWLQRKDVDELVIQNFVEKNFQKTNFLLD